MKKIVTWYQHALSQSALRRRRSLVDLGDATRCISGYNEAASTFSVCVASTLSVCTVQQRNIFIRKIIVRSSFPKEKFQPLFGTKANRKRQKKYFYQL
jgi:hypothetical protein